ncbi:fumarylacetoacetase [Rubrivivax sp. JA1024]|nr:fumarylacetoacetase [Rubrivivax sp. JA1024]
MSAARLDATHDPLLLSWVESANRPGADFPIQNLPLGRFRPRRSDEPLRAGVAIGDQILDLRLALEQCPWADDVYPLLGPLAAGDVNTFMAMGRGAWRRLREALSEALAEGSDQGPFLELCLLPQAQAEMALPCGIAEFTEFHAGIHHAAAVGRLARPDHPLLPNYKWVPLACHGRASSVGLGAEVQRPRGQVKGAAEAPEFVPTRRLDFELEIGVVIGRASAPGEPLTMAQAEDTIFGLVLLNDWSARDLLAWEGAPLGPFLGKNFATSISPWIVTMEALAPFRRPQVRPAGDPPPLPYLDSAANRAAGALDVVLESWLATPAMVQPAPLATSSLLDAYWTPAQLVAHHASNGCPLHPGDLLGTGAISGPQPGQGASLLELTQGGRQPLTLPGGEQRVFLHDGDSVILRGSCQRRGAVRIGFGTLASTVRG